MASTAAERKAKERHLKKEQGMTLKQIWLLPSTIEIIEKYKIDNSCTDEEAINKLINKALT